MLICIADSEYFNIALKRILMNQTASLWILKKYSVTRLVDRVRCSILFLRPMPEPG